jgi:hypothetical protein
VLCKLRIVFKDVPDLPPSTAILPCSSYLAVCLPFYRSNYSHGRTTLLAIQVDAAINSGNSGGPVLLGDHVVGIAFQCLTSGENIG